jgi:hypothetical protein
MKCHDNRFDCHGNSSLGKELSGCFAFIAGICLDFHCIFQGIFFFEMDSKEGVSGIILTGL